MTPHLRRLLIAGSVLLVIALLVLWLVPEGDLSGFPHTYITVAGMGWDPARVQVWSGKGDPPASLETAEGKAWPCYFHPDEAVLPRRDGQPLLFPLRVGEQGPQVPPLPDGLRLSPEQMERLERFQTAEGQRILDALRQRTGN